ncbi:MAG TPA: VOC family protein [Streptosporangiaceae bacterium]|nr:VOC family protein [Streptosporangiaceae bacterium]
MARLAARGATELHRGQQGPLRWVTMADPEGNEFCVG